jgi:hypothetical protein
MERHQKFAGVVAAMVMRRLLMNLPRKASRHAINTGTGSVSSIGVAFLQYLHHRVARFRGQ